MSSSSSACKTTHASPSFREPPTDSAGVTLGQGGCFTHDQWQMLGTEFEMSEAEYTHFQHFGPCGGAPCASSCYCIDARSPPTGMPKDAPESAVISTITTAQAIDLSTSTDENCPLMPGENTPASYGDVPGFVLARVKGEDSPSEPHDDRSTSPQKRARSAARVCLEKRFNTTSAVTPRQQDVQSAVAGNFLTILQQSSEAQEAFIHPPMQNWMKTEKVIGRKPHMAEPQHQGLIFPTNFLLNLCQERVVAKPDDPSGSNSAREQHLENLENNVATPAAASREHDSNHSTQPMTAAKAAPDSAGKSGSNMRKIARPHVSLSQRRERHNSKERERRKKIRTCCDELNTLVPFCNSGSDKATTLQWTTAFLRYISKTYGDTFKQEFQKAFTDEKGHFLRTSSSPGQEPIQRGVDETLSTPLVVEQ